MRVSDGRVPDECLCLALTLILVRASQTRSLPLAILGALCATASSRPSGSGRRVLKKHRSPFSMFTRWSRRPVFPPLTSLWLPQDFCRSILTVANVLQHHATDTIHQSVMFELAWLATSLVLLIRTNYMLSTKSAPETAWKLCQPSSCSSPILRFQSLSIRLRTFIQRLGHLLKFWGGLNDIPAGDIPRCFIQALSWYPIFRGMKHALRIWKAQSKPKKYSNPLLVVDLENGATLTQETYQNR